MAPTKASAGYGQPDPIPGALVYVPNGTVEPLNPDGNVSCDQCSDGVSGSPLVSATTGTDGTFTLTNVPCGVPVPVVIQLGKWRRQVTVPALTCCASNTMTLEQSRLPRTQSEGNIPRIAVVTGDADAIECVLPKIGIADSEYSLPSGTGRVRFYRDNGQSFEGDNNPAANLFDTPSELRKYDMIILDCVGKQSLKTAQQRLNMEAYANAGGRIFASHFAYVWLFGAASDAQTHTISFTGTAKWKVQQPSPGDQDAFIDTSFSKGVTFGQWVNLVGAQAGPSKIHISTVRHDLDAVISPAQRWVYGSDYFTSQIPFQYTFNTPVAAKPENQCGRVLFSDFHVIDATSGGFKWPGACKASPMTAQEKVFEYLLFDLSSCIKPDVPPPQSCTPTTCATHGFTCGLIGDGCGGSLNCGTCTGSTTCGGGGQPNVCGLPGCTPRSCLQLGATCGIQGDGCGGTLTCGDCTGPQSCGGGATPNVCGGTCTPKTCAQLGFDCGLTGDGCGGSIDCGSCSGSATCGGGGRPNVCEPACVSRTCGDLQAQCGPQGDGCGGALSCGDCTAPLTCGGDGTPNVCGGGTCVPKTCAQLGFECGPQGDGCGNVVQCGTCPSGQSCGGAGPGVCGTITCTPLTCETQGLHCGPAGDGCGKVIQCGDCPSGSSCGCPGAPGVCVAPTCVPRTCKDAGATCGPIGDGCGGSIDCGTCAPGETCGGGGVANVCGGIG